jgi:hypothetical protein
MSSGGSSEGGECPRCSDIMTLIISLSRMRLITKVGPSEVWNPTLTNKTITIKAATWKRLQKYGNHFGSTYDGIITQILDALELQHQNSRTS